MIEGGIQHGTECRWRGKRVWVRGYWSASEPYMLVTNYYHKKGTEREDKRKRWAVRRADLVSLREWRDQKDAEAERALAKRLAKWLAEREEERKLVVEVMANCEWMDDVYRELGRTGMRAWKVRKHLHALGYTYDPARHYWEKA